MRDHHSPLPGRWLTFGLSCTYLTLLVLLPLSMLIVGLTESSPAKIWALMSSARVLAAFKLSLAASGIAAGVNAIMGTIIAWVLARYSFPGRRILDGLVDLPFALPTAVSGIALTALYSPKGILGQPFAALGIKVAFAPLGICIALIFVGLPFVVRTIQPVLEELDLELEEAAASLGAGRLISLRTVVLPALLPTLLTGFGLAFARGLGEYGSIVFISGNLPLKTEVVPLIIMGRLEQFDYQGAVIIAVMMLLASLVIFACVHLVQRAIERRIGRA